MSAAPLRRIVARLKGPPEDWRHGAEEAALNSASANDRSIIEQAFPFTVTGPSRLQALIDAVRYCEKRGIAGDFAECGVWKGGSVLAMILTLQELGRDDVDIHLFDTFEGMTQPSEEDVSSWERPALETWQEARDKDAKPWSELLGDSQSFNEPGVRQTLLSTGYPESRLHFVRGPVEETLPDRAPDAIALLRLDTDWYESTRHELIHLYPRLSLGGVLIIDDYGHWDGARRAVDEYFADGQAPLLLNRIDYSGRIAVKT